jgi:pimeloyl-ACP methyl ester carboxylesterase
MSLKRLSSGQVVEIECRGEGGANVLLAHGLSSVHRYVLMGSKALERNGRKVVAYDARGHGESEPAHQREDYGYKSLVADALSVMDAADVDKALIVGVSMGAHTAAALALANPERVSGMVLVTPAFDPEVQPSAQALAGWDALADGLESEGVEGFLRAWGDGGVSEQWGAVVRRAIHQRMAIHKYPSAVADALRSVPRSRPFESSGELSAITCPTVVIGSRDEADPGHPLATAGSWAKWIPGAQLLVEEEGESPLAWRGRIISEAAESVLGRVA